MTPGRGGHARGHQARHGRLPAQLRRPARRSRRSCPASSPTCCQRRRGHRGRHGHQPAPHNPDEIFDAHRRASSTTPTSSLPASCCEIVPGPDFPTGGIVRGPRGIIEAYATGRGKVIVRGRVHTEEIGNGREQIVIDEIPYQLIQNDLVERIVDGGRRTSGSRTSRDVRNESGREAQHADRLELKQGADPEVVENQLYQFTPLQRRCSIMNIALVNRQPRTLALKELIELLHRAPGRGDPAPDASPAARGEEAGPRARGPDLRGVRHRRGDQADPLEQHARGGDRASSWPAAIPHPGGPRARAEDPGRA